MCVFDDITGIDDPEWLQLGAEMDANIFVAHKEGYETTLKRRLQIGGDIEICEGGRVVARGIVTAIY